MPLQKLRDGNSWAVVDLEGQVHGTGLSETEAERMVRASYAPGNSQPRRGMNLPYQYGGSQGTNVETGG